MNDWRDTPEPGLEPPEPKVMYHCANCQEPIYEGDRYWYIRGRRYCEDCIDAAESTAE